MHTTRIAPVTNPSDEVNELFDKAGLSAPDGSPLNIFGTLAHHPALLRRWMVFATHVLAKNSLDATRSRAADPAHGLALRVAVRVQPARAHRPAQRHHRRRGAANQVGRSTDGGGDDHDAALLNAADELHDDACISDATWATLARGSPTSRCSTSIFTVGNYHIVSFALNSCGVQLDEGVPPALSTCQPTR